jgi:hypothetical protein
MTLGPVVRGADNITPQFIDAVTDCTEVFIRRALDDEYGALREEEDGVAA